MNIFFVRHFSRGSSPGLLVYTAAPQISVLPIPATKFLYFSDWHKMRQFDDDDSEPQGLAVQ